jgi:hypothetical protein
MVMHCADDSAIMGRQYTNRKMPLSLSTSDLCENRGGAGDGATFFCKCEGRPFRHG